MLLFRGGINTSPPSSQLHIDTSRVDGLYVLVGRSTIPSYILHRGGRLAVICCHQSPNDTPTRLSEIRLVRFRCPAYRSTKL